MPEKGGLSLESADSARVGDLPILHTGAEAITIDPAAPLSHSHDFGKMVVRQLPLP